VSDNSVCVVGAGYVGLVTATALAENGRDVRILERDPRRVEQVRAGRAPVREEGLDAALARVVGDGRLHATGDAARAMHGAGIAVIAVGTPQSRNGGADLTQVRAALRSVAAHAQPDTLLVLKSTVPPGTTRTLAPLASRDERSLPLLACPEFLREGSALRDVRNPARLVVGGDDAEHCARVAALFATPHTPVIVTDPTSAEMVKYGANALLALKISFVNELAHLCDLLGGDIDTVADGVGADPRIGRAFLDAGLGFGGSCFPKDVRALEDIAGSVDHSFWLLRAAIEVNVQQRRRVVAKLRRALGGNLLGRRIAVLGLAFKPGTDDVRQAPALDVVEHLQGLGASVAATDPQALDNAGPLLDGVDLHTDPYRCCENADAILLVTEWPQFRSLDWMRVAGVVAGRIVVDARNCLDPGALVAAGFRYEGVGRGAPSRAGPWAAELNGQSVQRAAQPA
jgi:UDPglucose 6-dehydrogenase